MRCTARFVLMIAVAAPAAAACSPAAAPSSEAAPAVAAAPKAPPSPSYQALDGRFHYYAVTKVEPLADHFTATFLDAEGAYCSVRSEASGSVVVDGCGYPATLSKNDEVPADRARLLPRLREAVLRAEPGAKQLHLRFDGAYRRVLLEEEVPCEGRHGHGYNLVELRYDEALTTVLDRRFVMGSACGAAPFYWASASPRWLPTTSPTGLLDTTRMKEPLPPFLLAALREVLAAPEVDRSTPPSPPTP